jgi:mannose-6-phosphate isomerase-like protein (cupin superfamily)
VVTSNLAREDSVRIRNGLVCFCLGTALALSSAAAAADRFGVTFVPNATALAQIEKLPQTDGIALIDYARGPNHSVLLVRRTRPGRAEVHTALTDVWYVIDGGGTLVTGGALQNAKKTEAGEVRGSGVSDGIAHHIGKGDIIDIPAGVPHWVSRVDGKELVYLTVKVAKPSR